MTDRFPMEVIENKDSKEIAEALKFLKDQHKQINKKIGNYHLLDNDSRLFDMSVFLEFNGFQVNMRWRVKNRPSYDFLKKKEVIAQLSTAHGPSILFHKRSDEKKEETTIIISAVAEFMKYLEDETEFTVNFEDCGMTAFRGERGWTFTEIKHGR